MDDDQTWVSQERYEALQAYANDLKARNAQHVGKVAGLNSVIARQRTEIARLKAELTLAKQKRRKSLWTFFK